MNMKSVISRSILWATLLTISCTTEKEKQQQLLLREQQITESINAWSRTQLLQALDSKKAPFHDIKMNDSIYKVYLNKINQKPNTDTLTIDMDTVRQWPLWTMKKVPKNLAALLWYHHYDKEVLIAYNPELDSLLRSKNLEQIWYHEIKQKTIKTPAIYPDLKDFAKPTLQDFIKDKPQWVQDSLKTDHEVMIITRNEENKAVILYYDNDIIQLAQYSSPGIWWKKRKYDHNLKKYRIVDRSTPEGILYTNRNKDLLRPYITKNKKIEENWTPMTINDTIWRTDPYSDTQNKNRISLSFDAPMPYAIPIADSNEQSPIFLHQWETNWSHLSSWCPRQTGQSAMEIYKRIDGRVVKVAIFNLYDKKKNQ